MKDIKTLLIQVTDYSKYKEFNDKIFESMIEGVETDYGFKLVGFSNEDEFARIEDYESSLDDLVY